MTLKSIGEVNIMVAEIGNVMAGRGVPAPNQPAVERRSGIERRRYTYAGYLPERRKRRNRRRRSAQKARSAARGFRGIGPSGPLTGGRVRKRSGKPGGEARNRKIKRRPS